MRRIALAAFAAFALPFVSCAAAQQLGDVLAPYTPKIKFQKLAVDHISFSDIGVDFVFAVENPNPIAVKLDTFGYSLGLEGVEFVKGRNTDGFQLKSKGDTELVIPVTTTFAKIYELVKTADGKDDIAFSLAGDFGFNTPVGVASVPFKEEGRFPVVHAPSVSLKGAKLKDFNILKGKATLAVDLGFANDKGGSPLSFKGFDYGLTLAKKPVSSGVLDNVPDAPAGQEQVVSLPVNLDLVALGSSVVSILKGKDPVDVGLNAKVMVGTPFGAIPLDIAQTAAFLLK